MTRIPFDSLCVRAVLDELDSFVGGRVQEIRSANATDIVLTFYASGREGSLLISCHPEFARMHFVTKRRANPPSPPVWLSTLRARLDGTTLALAEQINGDRLVVVTFTGGQETHRLAVELMGKHSNIILIEGKDRIVGAAKWVQVTQSRRPITPNAAYVWPPVLAGQIEPISATHPQASREQILEAARSGSGSAFLKKLLLASPHTPKPVNVLSLGNGAYPLSVAPLDLPELERTSLSVALEQHYDQAIPAAAAEALKHTLFATLQRVVLARDVALADLHEALERGAKAGRNQLKGDLILAYGSGLPEGAAILDAWDYEGNPISITLNPELDFKGNATSYFERAKKAKGALSVVAEQIDRLSRDRVAVLELLSRVINAARLDAMRELHQEAQDRRWLIVAPLPTANKEDRPYEGHRIKSLMGPGGAIVLYGENAESNDYLTLRIAKPNDYWLHVRGATSAHVVIQTVNKPDRVGSELLNFAAKVAVQHSTSKHSGYVSVDYTLKKYVRKPRGAAKGTATYSHEKTLNILSQET